MDKSVKVDFQSVKINLSVKIKKKIDKEINGQMC